MQERTDLHMARIIELGIAIDTEKGAAHAWAFFTFNGVPPHIAARVLADAGRRRASDAASAAMTSTPPAAM